MKFCDHYLTLLYGIFFPRSLGHPVESQNKPIVKSTLALPNGNASHESETGAVKVIPLSNEEAPHHKIGASGNIIDKENGTACDQVEVKPLILFEDVDIAFLEDRGFIAAIQQIAETAKGPMILTSNSKREINRLRQSSYCFEIFMLLDLFSLRLFC